MVSIPINIPLPAGYRKKKHLQSVKCPIPILLFTMTRSRKQEKKNGLAGSISGYNHNPEYGQGLGKMFKEVSK